MNLKKPSIQPIDMNFIQKQFPILVHEKNFLNGKRWCYLDTANTSLTPVSVQSKTQEYYQEYNANVHRSIYSQSITATEEMEKSRRKIQEFISAEKSEEIIFTRGATESINMVVYSWGQENLDADSCVLLTEMEHHSNIVPWQILQKKIGFTLKYIPIDENYNLDLCAYENILKKENVKIVSCILQSNVLGVVNPMDVIIQQAHDIGAKVLVDASQAMAHSSVDVVQMNADFLVFTGHKMYGPTGIGVLYAKKSLLEQMPPVYGGGDMIKHVSLDHSSWNDLPYKFEAGTPNISGAIGLGAAVDFINTLGLANISCYEENLRSQLLKMLHQKKNLTLFAHSDKLKMAPLVSFKIDGVHPHDIASILSDNNVAVRAGHHCAQPLMETLKVPATTRVSFGVYNTIDDIRVLSEALDSVYTLFY